MRLFGPSNKDHKLLLRAKIIRWHHDFGSRDGGYRPGGRYDNMDSVEEMDFPS
jgi:hypothetical protein